VGQGCGSTGFKLYSPTVVVAEQRVRGVAVQVALDESANFETRLSLDSIKG
jgi:hypothetical protein